MPMIDKDNKRPAVMVPEAARLSGVSESRIRYRLDRGLVPGAVKRGSHWFIPAAAVDGLARGLASGRPTKGAKARKGGR